MLKSRIPTGDIVLRTDVFTEDFSSDRDFYNQKLLNFSTNSVINGVIDSEIYEYKPELTNELNFNIFFLRYVQNNEYNDLKNYIELGFQTQYNNSKLKFGLINISGIEIPKAFNNVYETRQSNGLRETPVLVERALTKLQELKQKPYFVRDLVGESTLKKPIKSGIPVFYNSFTLPYWDNKDKWINETLLYTNKPYFYNSFLLMEFYDSPSNVTQNRVQSIPIFVNNRYNITEKNVSKNFNYERPCFKLSNGVEGYSFFFLENYITNEFYVRYSFWDALNGKKIPLLPSSNLNLEKKWLQNPDNFNQNTRYLKYVLDYDNRTYKIYEYNTITKEFDTERTNFDLYELEFDPYYKNKAVPNQVPVDSRTSVAPTELANPFTFSVKNLYTNNYVGDSSVKYSQLTQQQINNSDNFLDITKSFIETFNTYIGNINTDVFGDLPKKEMILPVVNRKITGYQILLKSFLLKNNDTTTWNIRNVEFKDIKLQINGVNVENTYYNQRQSLWNENPSFRVSEAITMLSSVGGLYNFSYGTFNFTKEVVYTYLDDSSVFRNLLNLIERERFYMRYTYIYSDVKIIPVFLDKCFATLKVRYNQGHIKTKNYLGNAIIPNRKKLDYEHSEIYNYINQLVEAYTKLKTTNISEFNNIKNMAISLLETYMVEQQDYYGICKGVVNYISGVLTPKDNQELVNKYVSLVSKKDVTADDKNKIEKNITQNSLPLLLDKTVSELGYEPRDYVFETFTIQNGDKFIIPGESNKIDFYFNIGEKVKFIASNSSEIIVRGKLRLSIINNSGEIKNIVIPIKSTIKTKLQAIRNIPKNIPKYTASEPELGSKINQLTSIR